MSTDNTISSDSTPNILAQAKNYMYVGQAVSGVAGGVSAAAIPVILLLAGHSSLVALIIPCSLAGVSWTSFVALSILQVIRWCRGRSPGEQESQEILERDDKSVEETTDTEGELGDGTVLNGDGDDETLDMTCLEQTAKKLEELDENFNPLPAKDIDLNPIVVRSNDDTPPVVEIEVGDDGGEELDEFIEEDPINNPPPQSRRVRSNSFFVSREKISELKRTNSFRQLSEEFTFDASIPLPTIPKAKPDHTEEETTSSTVSSREKEDDDFECIDASKLGAIDPTKINARYDEFKTVVVPKIIDLAKAMIIARYHIENYNAWKNTFPKKAKLDAELAAIEDAIKVSMNYVLMELKQYESADGKWLSYNNAKLIKIVSEFFTNGKSADKAYTAMCEIVNDLGWTAIPPFLYQLLGMLRQTLQQRGGKEALALKTLLGLGNNPIGAMKAMQDPMMTGVVIPLMKVSPWLVFDAILGGRSTSTQTRELITAILNDEQFQAEMLAASDTDSFKAHAAALQKVTDKIPSLLQAVCKKKKAEKFTFKRTGS